MADVVGPVRDAAGVTVRVRTSDPTLAAHLDSLLAAFPVVEGEADIDYRVASGDGRAWTLFVDGERVAARKRNRVAELLQWHCNRSVILAAVRRTTTLHAGVVARDGRAVLLPAPMDSGKSTLTAGLLRRGLDYLTDEAAIIVDGVVHAYPKVVGIDPGSHHLFPELEPDDDRRRFTYAQWHVPPAVVGAGRVAATAEPAVVVVPHYTGSGTTALSHVGPAEAVRLLAENTFGFHDRPVAHLRVHAALVEACSVHRMEVSDLETACDLVLGLLER